MSTLGEQLLKEFLETHHIGSWTDGDAPAPPDPEPGDVNHDDLAMDEFVEAQHPREGHGKFTGKGGGAAPAAAAAARADPATRELFDRVSKPDGGFTYQPLTHEEPASGFALSPYPERSFATDAQTFSFDDLVGYVVKNHDVMLQPDHYVGAWHDPQSHKVYLDVSIVSKDAKQAEQLALKHDQIAYYDLAAGKSVDVNRNATSGGATLQ